MAEVFLWNLTGSPTMSTDDPLYVQSIAKAFGLIEAFSIRSGPLSLKDLATISGMDRSSAQRMAFTLTALGYLEKDEGKSYSLGRKMLDRTFDYLSGNELIERATPILVDLQKEIGERVDLSIYDGTSLIFALRRQSRRVTFSATLVGRRIQTYASSGGRSILANLPEDEMNAILDASDLKEITPKTITDPKVIREKIEEARRSSYGLAVEETMLGEIGIGAAVLDRAGRPVGALHISGSLATWTTTDFCNRFAPLCIEAAKALQG